MKKLTCSQLEELQFFYNHDKEKTTQVFNFVTDGVVLFM